jgi:ferredoxin
MPDRFEVVEEDCIGCGLCSERAPENLEIPDGTSIALVFKQPASSAEEEACLEASDYCPMGGLHAGAVASPPPAESSADGAQPTLTPVGGTTPGGTTPATQENET